MPKYRVHLYQIRTRTAAFVVEAEDEFHAEEIALAREQTEDTPWGEDVIDDGGVDFLEEVE
jgi:hypothetical protein